MSRDSETDTIQVRRSGRGYAVEGPGYYVWDEDLEQLVSAAHELACGGLPDRPIGRMRVIRPEPGA